MSGQVSACSRCGGGGMPGHPSYLGSGMCCADQCPRAQARGYYCIRHIRSLELAPAKVLATRRCAFCNRDAKHLSEARIGLHTYLEPTTSALRSLLSNDTIPQDVSPATQPPVPIVLLKKVPGSRKRAARPRGFHRLKKPALNHPFGLHPHRSANELDNAVYLGSDEDLDEPSSTTLTEQSVSAMYVPATKTLPPRSDVCAGGPTCSHPPDASGYCPTHRNQRTQRTPPTSAPLPSSNISPAPIPRSQPAASATLATSTIGHRVEHTRQEVHQCSNVFCTQPAIAANGFCVAHASFGAAKTSVMPGSAVCAWQQCHAAAIVGGEGPPRCVLHRYAALPIGTEKPPSVQAVCRNNWCRNRVDDHGDVCASHSAAPATALAKCRSPNCDYSAKSNGFCRVHFRTTDAATVGPTKDLTPPLNPTVPPPTPATSPPIAAQPVDGLTSALPGRRLASLSATVATCKEDSTTCARMAFFHGYCRAHFSARRCGLLGCNNLRDGVKYCQDHQEKPPGDQDGQLNAHCTIAHCSDVAMKHGYCAAHVPVTTHDLPAASNSLVNNSTIPIPSSSTKLEKMPATPAVAAFHVSRPSIVAPPENPGASSNDSVIPPSSTAAPLCQIPNCTHGQKTNGLCRKHYNESVLASQRDLTVPVPAPATAPSPATSIELADSSVTPTRTPCTRQGCALSAEAESDFCKAHHHTAAVESSVAVEEPSDPTVALTTTTTPMSLADAPSTTPKGQIDTPSTAPKGQTDTSSTAPARLTDATNYAPKGQTGAPSTAPTAQTGAPKFCKVPDCILTAKTQGLCRGHALTNPVQPVVAFSSDRPAVVSTLCKASGCTIAAKLKGYCRKHGNLIELAPSPVASPVAVATHSKNYIKPPVSTRTPYLRCRTHGCRRKVHANGQCSIHCSLPTTCSVNGCLFTSQVDGYCDSHYNASR